MPYVSKVLYQSTGAPTPLSVTFPFISRAHVKLYLNATPTTAFTWLNNSTILPSVVPPSGGVIEIKRQTPTDVRLVDFSDGSTLTAEALDTSSAQMLYIVQEAYDSVGYDGNYTMAGGYQVATDDACNYSIGWGRDITFTAAADYSAGFGNQTTLGAPYTFAAGRGHTVADQCGSAVGAFSAYKTAQANPVVHQIGIGTSLAAAKNAVTVRADGLMEILVSSTADPEKNSEASIQLVNNTTLKIKARGTDGVVRSVTLTLS